MNINPIVEKALYGIGCPVSAVRIKPGEKPETYITYYTVSESGELFADDEERAETTYGTVDLFSKTNYKKILKNIKSRLKKAGFMVTSSGPEMWENDTGYFHIPVSFYLESESEETEENDIWQL